MKRFLIGITALFAAVLLHGQEVNGPYDALSAKLDEYFAAMAGEPVAVQNAECDFLVQTCQDSLVRQFVALKIYDHYLQSPIMGEDGVAVHMADAWFIPGKVAMHSELDLLNAKVFAEFNRQSLLGADAPVLTMADPSGNTVTFPQKGAYTVLYFYDISCSTCRLESPRLRNYLLETDFPLQCIAVYTGLEEEGWEDYRAASLDVPGMVHVWDPDIDSDYQRKYGVLQTPRMFLVDPEGKVVGRGLDTPALSLLVGKISGKDERYVYGTRESLALYENVFAGYGDDLQPSDITDVASYVAERTFGEGSVDNFKHMEGDLLYFLSSRTGEVYKEGTRLFIDQFILNQPEVWNTAEDTAKVVSMALTMQELLGRTPVGSTVPDLRVHGELLQRPCLLRKASRKGTFSLRKADYLIFYTESCGRCKETLAAARSLADAGNRLLLVNMDELFSSYPDEGKRLLDTFDLSALPFILQLDGNGTVLHRYLDFSGK